MAFSLLNIFLRRKIKKVALLGVGGNTGRYYSKLLLSHDFSVIGFDDNPDILSKLDKDIIKHKNFSLGGGISHLKEKYHEFDAITLSPGISLQDSSIQDARQRERFVFSEIEYCCEFLKDRRLIGVTGTDGKSTTTAVLEHLLGADKAIACANYGVAFSQILYEKKNQPLLVAELSSYQLELARNLSLEVALFLNIAHDHLNRYKNFAAYLKTKWQIVRSLSSGGTLIAEKSLLYGRYFWSIAAHVLSVLLRAKLNRKKIIGINARTLRSQNFRWNLSTSGDYALHFARPEIYSDELINSTQIKLAGRHNYANLLFAVETLWVLLQKQFSQQEAVEELRFRLKELTTFKPLSHRFEKVYEDERLVFINDSKATTTQAALTALSNIEQGYIFLGGQSKVA